ncbi:MAG: hypothetical protein HRU70_01830 [Phycisphaeraceae bacterium]|nr:MAG: hypothetical protein HRU70_01830 [Phycisphaeraceae bacterium]
MEVLAVLGMTTILMSLMLPALGRARDAGVRALCLSRLRGVGVLMHAYAGDSRDAFPYAGDDHAYVEIHPGSGHRWGRGGRGGLKGGAWATMLPDLWESPSRVGKALMCPKQPPWRMEARQGIDPDHWPLPKYAMSAALWLDAGRMRPGVEYEDQRPRANMLSDVQFPSSKVMMFEHALACWKGPYDTWYQFGLPPPRAWSAVVAADGSGSRRIREDDLPGYDGPHSVWNYTLDGVRGRDFR